MPRHACAGRAGGAEKKNPMTVQLPIHRFSPAAALARIALVLALLSVPMLALAGAETEAGRFVGTDIQRSSGAGLVIVLGLQRAR
jgi:hypothetical protein